MEDINKAKNAVLVKSEKDETLTKVSVKGYDFNDYNPETTPIYKLLESFKTTGFQATHLHQAMEIINQMLNYSEKDEETGKDIKCKIFLGYTSNMVSSGLRETFRYLVEHRMVDCIVTTAGGIEEDIIKCLAPTFISSFNSNDNVLRTKGLNRIGNLVVPNENYCMFEDFMNKVLDQMLIEQKENKTVFSPSKLINRLGKEINNEESICYWAYKNNIPIFCPAITDGSLGDMIFFHSYNNPGLVIDLVQDIKEINSTTIHAKKTGMIILGSGVVKHHICNANLMRNGADYAVYINTAQEYDGSDAGARPEEAVSWGKIQPDGTHIKVTFF